MLTVTVGRRDGDHLSIEVGGREHPQASDFDDGNWLVCLVSLRAGGFSGKYGASLRSEELARFRDAVRLLNETLQGEALFETLEGQLRVTIERVGGLGGLRVIGTALDAAGLGNRLSFELKDFDQTDLRDLIAALNEVVSTFPVIGR